MDSATSISSAFSDLGANNYIDEEGRFNDILSTPVLRKYFLERAAQRLKDSLECPVSVKKWDKLLEVSSQLIDSILLVLLILRVIVMTKEEIAEHEQLLNLLIFVTKLYKDVSSLMKPLLIYKSPTRLQLNTSLVQSSETR